MHNKLRKIFMLMPFAFMILLILILLTEDRYNKEKDAYDDIKETKPAVESPFPIANNIDVGDTITFGTYYDFKNENENEIYFVPLKWNVIDKKDDSVLLITDKIIANEKYNFTLNSISWKDSSIRRWLNEDFYFTAFTSSERKHIKESICINTMNQRFNINAGENTIDKVFLLSLDEVSEYFATNEERRATGTRYALSKGLWVSNVGRSKGFSVWWLRSPGMKPYRASLVYAGGAQGDIGDNVTVLGNGVRPCIWVTLQ